MDVSYERLAEEAKRYDKWDNGELYDAYLNFIDRNNYPKENLGQNQRIIIVAPDSDTGLKNIILWLENYGVPIEFVPFHLYVDDNDNPKLFMVEGVTSSPEISNVEEEWAGHWIFNTDESKTPGAYKKMFKNNIAAIWGYESGSRTLEGSNPGDIVLAYVNGQGIRGLGRVVNGEVREGEGVFLDKAGNQKPDEYHMSVEWEIILPKEDALSSSEAAEIGYNLPIRLTFGRLLRGQTAMKIENKIRNRK